MRRNYAEMTLDQCRLITREPQKLYIKRNIEEDLNENYLKMAWFFHIQINILIPTSLVT